MKKSVKFVLLGAVAAMSVAAVSVSDVNSKVAALLAPFNNKVTVASVEFTDLNIDAVKTLDFGVKAKFWKVGSQNELTLKVDNVEYHFGDGQNPALSAHVSVGLDLVKIFGQDGINEMAEGLGEMVKGLASQYTEKYGEAATLEADVNQIVKDEKGNVLSAKVFVTASIDFSKLPANLKLEDVEFKKFELSASVSNRTVEIGGSAVLNPAYKGFRQDEDGLKEYIEKLLNEDQETYESLAGLISALDSFAKDMVEAKAGSN
jgi:hypothetical protein